MPYIDQTRRVGLREPIDQFISTLKEPSQLHEFVMKIALVHQPDSKLAVNAELARRERDGQDITGDINFCICRLLVGYTKIHEDPKYWKVSLINKVLRKAQNGVSNASSWFLPETIERAAAVLDDVKMELYRRYAGPYEDLKCAENGDIMDDYQ